MHILRSQFFRLPVNMETNYSFSTSNSLLIYTHSFYEYYARDVYDSSCIKINARYLCYWNEKIFVWHSMEDHISNIIS